MHGHYRAPAHTHTHQTKGRLGTETILNFALAGAACSIHEAKINDNRVLCAVCVPVHRATRNVLVHASKRQYIGAFIVLFASCFCINVGERAATANDIRFAIVWVHWRESCTRTRVAHAFSSKLKIGFICALCTSNSVHCGRYNDMCADFQMQQIPLLLPGKFNYTRPKWRVASGKRLSTNVRGPSFKSSVIVTFIAFVRCFDPSNGSF